MHTEKAISTTRMIGRWGVDLESWLDGFRTGTWRKLGLAPQNMHQQSWLAGYFEGVQLPERYDLVETEGTFQIHRFGPGESESFDVEGGTFKTRRQAEDFLQAIQRLIQQKSSAADA